MSPPAEGKLFLQSKNAAPHLPTHTSSGIILLFSGEPLMVNHVPRPRSGRQQGGRIPSI